MFKLPFIVCFVILLSGCGAKGDLFLADPKAQQPNKEPEKNAEPSPEMIDLKTGDSEINNKLVLGLGLRLEQQSK